MKKSQGAAETSQHKLETNVTFVFRHFHPILAGAAERFRRYSIPLAEEGFKFQTCTLREMDEHAEHETLHQGMHVYRITAHGGAWQRDAVLFQHALAALRQLPPSGQVLQTSISHGLARPWLKRIRAHGVGCMYVGTMVGDDSRPAPYWRRILKAWRTHRDYAPFDVLVASTGVMAEWMVSRGLNKNRIEVIPNGVDTRRFHPASSGSEKAAIRTSLGLDPVAPLILFVGSIVPRKGVDLLLRSWPGVLSAHPSARLVFVGGFERPTFMTVERMTALTEYQNAVRALADSPEMRGSVSFAGETPEVEKWMRAADIFVFPTEQEGMGNVVLEAMACGLPCVITQFNGMPKEEFGQAGKHFHLVPRTEQDLTRGLKLALLERADVMGMHAREWAVSQMDISLTLSRYASLYRRLARTDS